jgi:hypothetical protein
VGRCVLFPRDRSQHTFSDYSERQNVPGAVGHCSEAGIEVGISLREVVTYLSTELKLVVLENFKSRLVTSVDHGRKICCRK